MYTTIVREDVSGPRRMWPFVSSTWLTNEDSNSGKRLDCHPT